MGSTSSKLIFSLQSSLVEATTSAILSKGNTPKFGWNMRGVALLSRKSAISLKRDKEQNFIAYYDRSIKFQAVGYSITINCLF